VISKTPLKLSPYPDVLNRIKSVKCDHKAHIIGDSHIRRSATKISQYLNTNFVVSSFIKPGDNIKQIVHSQEMEFKHLGKKDDCG